MVFIINYKRNNIILEKDKEKITLYLNFEEECSDFILNEVQQNMFPWYIGKKEYNFEGFLSRFTWKNENEGIKEILKNEEKINFYPLNSKPKLILENKPLKSIRELDLFDFEKQNLYSKGIIKYQKRENKLKVIHCHDMMGIF